MGYTWRSPCMGLRDYNIMLLEGVRISIQYLLLV